MNAELHVGGVDRWTLSGAILLYRHTGALDSATVHEVKDGEILAGRPLSISELESITARLAGDGHDGYLPENILSLSATRIVWWRPSSPAQMFFGDKVSKLRSGRNYTIPPLVFLAKKNLLKVFALKKNVRPKPDTEIFQAPFMNVYDGGSVCLGSMKVPDRITPESAMIWQESFFDSRFTDQKVQLLRQMTHDQFWREPWKLNQLIPLRCSQREATLKDILNEEKTANPYAKQQRTPLPGNA